VDLSGTVRVTACWYLRVNPTCPDYRPGFMPPGTGMTAMDVFFADEVIVPPAEKVYFSEELDICLVWWWVLYLRNRSRISILCRPCRWFTMTFGSPESSWPRYLKPVGVPGPGWCAGNAREQTGAQGNQNSMMSVYRQGVIDQFVNAGVEADRIILLGKTSWLPAYAGLSSGRYRTGPFSLRRPVSRRSKA